MILWSLFRESPDILLNISKELTLHAHLHSSHWSVTWLYGVSQLDATRRGGLARFINHSCDVSLSHG